MPDTDSSSSDDTESSSSDQESSSSASESSSDDAKSSTKKLTKEQLEAEVTRVRAEAANYRTRLRVTEDKLKNAKTPEEVEAIKTELAAASTKDTRDLLVENVALNAKLPKELWTRLQGDTREELETDAKSLAKFALADAGPDADDLRGGLTPAQKRDQDPTDPGALAAKYSTRGRAARRANGS